MSAGTSHAAQRAHAAEVVADEVDDHEVLGARLLVVAQRRAAVGVLDGMGGARGGALDRLGLDASARGRRAGSARARSSAPTRRRGAAAPRAARGCARAGRGRRRAGRSRRRCAARWSGRSRSSRPRRSRACRRRCWRGRPRGPRGRRSAAQRAPAGAARRGGGRRAIASSSPSVAASHASAAGAPAASASATRWTRCLWWSKAITPVAEEQRRVGQRRAVHELAAQVGLELVAEVAGEAAGEVERQLGGVGAQARELAPAVLEDALVQLLAPVRAAPRSRPATRRRSSRPDRAGRPGTPMNEKRASPGSARELSSQTAWSRSP